VVISVVGFAAIDLGVPNSAYVNTDFSFDLMQPWAGGLVAISGGSSLVKFPMRHIRRKAFRR
jgi:hypothetical protein